MDHSEYTYLYEIAQNLNKEFSLPSALCNSLEMTVALLDPRTGWIWLVQKDIKSVGLAASFNLPPALSNRPERLSGWSMQLLKLLTEDVVHHYDGSQFIR